MRITKEWWNDRSASKLSSGLGITIATSTMLFVLSMLGFQILSVPEDAKQNIELWTGWIAGALLEAELEAIVRNTGFVDFEITWRARWFRWRASAAKRSCIQDKGNQLPCKKTCVLISAAIAIHGLMENNRSCFVHKPVGTGEINLFFDLQTSLKLTFFLQRGKLYSW